MVNFVIVMTHIMIAMIILFATIVLFVMIISFIQLEQSERDQLDGRVARMEESIERLF